jgi:hypothetical protein
VSDNQRSPIDAALDLLFYAPVGLALTAREELPRLIEKGRQRVGGQVTMARMVGQFAVNQGGQEAGKFVKQATEALSALGILPGSQRQPAPVRPSTGADRSRDTNGHRGAPSAGAGALGGLGPPRTADADELGIEGYDSLSASQVVQRLAGLSEHELGAVQSYEASTRGRRTILTRIAQLQADRA